MRRPIRAFVLAALMCIAIPAGSACAETTMSAQLISPSAQVPEAPNTAASQRKGEPLPDEPAAIEAPVVEEEMSEAAIVLLGTIMGVAGLAGFHYTGQWMHRRLEAKEQAKRV